MSKINRSYLEWRVHFVSNLCQEPAISWESLERLSEAERRFIVPSVRQFQLGEGASGRTFLALAEAESERLRIAELPDAIAVFIREEQRHSALLARFLLHEGEALEAKHWVAGGFRWLRKRIGFGFMVAVLSAAEVLAFPYYRGLARATASPLLRAISKHILREEVAHLRFQAMNLAVSGTGRPRWQFALLLLGQRFMLEAMTLLLHLEHRKILSEVGGYSATIRSARKLLASMQQESRVWRQRIHAERAGVRSKSRSASSEVTFVRNGNAKITKAPAEDGAIRDAMFENPEAWP